MFRRFKSSKQKHVLKPWHHDTAKGSSAEGQLPPKVSCIWRGFLAHIYSNKQGHSLVSLFLINLCASSAKTTSTEHLSKLNTFISIKINLCGSVQLNLDIPSTTIALSKGPETKSGHNKEEAIENRTQKKTSKGDLQRFHFMSHPWTLWLGEEIHF